MRIKTLALTAAALAAGVASSMAQNVYSLNVVGYMNVAVPSGFSIIANQLDAPTNTIASLLTGVPENTLLYKFANGAYTIASYAQDDDGNLVWDQPNLTLAPGEAAFIRNPGAQYTLTFVGEVRQSPSGGQLRTPLVAGFNLVSSQVPQQGQLDTVLGFPPVENDLVYLFRAGQYVISSYAQDDDGNLVWDRIPSPNVGEGFFVRTGAARNWDRTFTVN
jgi:hypothetical protein